MRDTPGSTVSGHAAVAYALAVVGVAVATAFRLSLDPVLGTQFPFAPLFVAVLWASAYGGAKPGLVAALLGFAAAARFLIPPRGSFFVEGSSNQAGMAFYLVVCVGIVYLGSAIRSTRLQAEALAARALEDAEKLRVTLASIGDGVIVTDDRGRVTSMNAVAEGLTGVTVADAEGRALEEVFEIVNEKTRQRVGNPVERVLAEGRVVGLANHTVLIARTGQERFIDDSAAPIRGSNGEVQGVVLVFREIGEKRRAEEATRRLASIVENSEDAIIGKALDGTITSWNAGAERLYGYTAQEAMGRTGAFLAPDDRAEEPTATLMRLREKKATQNLETVRRAKDGRLIDVSLSMAPIRDQEGNIIGSSTIARDITQHKRTAEAILRTEEALQRSEHLYRAIGESIDYGVWVCDPDGRNIYASESFLALVGLTQQQCSEFGWENVLHPDDAQRTMEAWKECVRTEGRWDVEHRFKGRDGQWHPVLARGGPVRNSRGAIIAWAGINLDIGRLKLAEAQLLAADHNKNDFLAVLSHELRNPLAPLRNALAILKRPDADDTTLAEARDMAERQVHHLARLVDDLLDVSRITHGKIELRRERTELSVAVAQAVETARPVIEAQRHQLEVSLPPQPIWLHADLVRIAQVLTNLLNNSAKYTTPGGTISLEVEAVAGEAVIRVRDSGIGIPEAALPRVFEMFTQASPAGARSPLSLGVGLRLVKSLVELHGGTVQAFSAGPGQGSEFVVRLPIAAAPLPGVVSEVQPPPPTRPRRILVVDDNADAASSLAVLLRLEGHDARVAHGGLEALEEVERSRPEVVFLDIGMPGMDGYEVARRLRAQHPPVALKLVALTGWGQEHDRQQARDAGFDHHLTKPVASNDLHALLAADPRP